MVVLEAAAIGAAGYGIYRGGEAAARKGQETLKEHRRESHRRGQRKELEQKTKERKDRLAQLTMMRGGPASAPSATTTSFISGKSNASVPLSSSSSTNSSAESSSVLDRMRAEHGTSSKGGGRLKSLFKKK